MLASGDDTSTRRAIRRFVIIVTLLEGSIEEACRILVGELRLRCIHHCPIVVLDYIDIDHASGDIRPLLLSLQLLHDFDALRCQVFLLWVEI